MPHTHSDGTTHSHDQAHYDEDKVYVRPADSRSWVPGLLMIPLLLLAGLAAYGAWNSLDRNETRNDTATVREVIRPTSTTQIGVGGAPQPISPTAAATLSPTMYPSPTLTPSISPTMTPTPTQSMEMGPQMMFK